MSQLYKRFFKLTFLFQISQNLTWADKAIPSDLIMYSKKKIKADEEIFSTYGRIKNWELLQRYGFALDNFDNSDLSISFNKEHFVTGRVRQ